MPHDIEQARRFLTLLDESAEKFTFQMFSDKKPPGSGIDVLAKWIHGDIDSLFDTLVKHNELGAGIFVMVNEGDGTGRENKAVKRVRCVFNENDHGLTKNYPDGIEPHIITQTSPGKEHHYFLCDDIGLDEFGPVLNRLIADYGSDPAATGLCRVLRVPGFYHQKGEPHLVTIQHESGAQPYHKDKLLEAFPPYIKSVAERNVAEGTFSSKLIIELRSALNYLDADEYHTWVNVGIALKNGGIDGRNLWLDWSVTSSKFDNELAHKKWDSFTADSVGYKSVFWLASESGWVNTAKKLDSTSNIIEDSSTGFNWLCADEMANNAKAPEYLINKILETDSHGLLAGGSMAFKTFVDLRMAYSICTGSNFFGYEVYTTGKVLYICGEGKGALSRRIKALKIVEGDFLGNLLVLDETISIDNAVQMAQLGMEIEKIKPVFIIFDTYSSLIGGVDENSNSEVSRSLKLIRETCGNASSLVVHHYGKDAARGSRGAGAFKANVDFEFALVREENTMNTVLSCVKMKDGEMFDDLNLTAHIVELGLIGQDGMQSSSLVLKPNVEIEIGHDAIVFTSLKDAWILDGVESDKYGNGASVELWKKTALVALNNLGKNKYREFSRSKARLIENKKIIEIDGFCFLSH